MVLVYLLTLMIAVASCFIISFSFRKLNLVDRPDGIRKIHEGDTPLGGGLALYISVYIAFLVLPENILGGIYSERSIELLTIWNVSIIILLLGFIDDLKPLPISIRLIVQILAS